jgi:hypothetical protein
MKFMGKWIIWSHAATGYVVPVMLPGARPTLLYANSIMDIHNAVYNIYGGPGEGELLFQANTLAGSPGCWLQCEPNASDPTLSVIPTEAPRANQNDFINAAVSAKTNCNFHAIQSLLP